jgi:chromate reductase, NAD(P)H dehydrogenase (quinone)
MRVLGIAGSVRSDSHNARLLRHAAERAPGGVEVEIWGGLKSIPPYDEDDDVEPAPPAVAELRRALADADALLIATPEYNSSIPGVLKNAIDWASRPRDATPLQNLPAAVIGASTGSFGAVWAQAELRKVLSSTGARVVDTELAVPRCGEAFDAEGHLAAPEQDERLAEIFAALAIEAAVGDSHPAQAPVVRLAA